MHDLLIKNGTLFDGTGAPGIAADVAVSGGVITEIAPNLNPKRAARALDARGMFVAPGFIDIQNHSDSYWTLFDQPEQASMLAQGITTIIIGNCGSSLAPLTSAEALKTIQKWHNLSGINVNWSTFREFLDTLASIKKGVNVGSLVGHATLRRALIGDQPRHAQPDEISVMEKMLKQALDEGGLGLSMGLVYAHEVDSTTEELIKLSACLKDSGKYLSVHLRSEAGAVLDAVDEAIDIAQRCDIPVKISHIKIRGKTNWQNFDRLISKLENAYHRGARVSFDVYPYSSSWSVLYTYLPRWSYEGGRSEILRRLRNPQDRRKILDYLKEQQYGYLGIIVATAPVSTGYIGKSIQEIAANQGVSNEEALLNVIASTDAQVVAFDHNLNDENVELFVSSPLSMVSTDGAGYNGPADALAHPRCFGAIPAFLKMVRERKLMKWEHALAKITGDPASLLGLPDRGVLAKGKAADITVFDPQTIADTATYDNPFRFPKGIKSVLVNGSLAWEDGSLKGLFGGVLRR